MREMLKWLPQQYMLHVLDENPHFARSYEGDGTCAVLFGHSLFIGGRYDPEAAHFLAESMLADHVTLAFCPDEHWINGLNALFPAAKTYKRSLYETAPSRFSHPDNRIIRVEKADLGKYENANILIEEVTLRVPKVHFRPMCRNILC